MTARDVVAPPAPERLDDLERRVAALESRSPAGASNKATIVVLSGDMEKVMSAYIIATGAASMGMDVTLFFTFWGLGALKKNRSLKGKSLLQRMMTLMTPAGMRRLGTSKFNFGGLGPLMFGAMMRHSNVASLEEIATVARELGVREVACTMTMDVMGVSKEELLPFVELGGVGLFVGEAADSKIQLYI
jgi:peroxiredoxin family protein